MSAAKRGMPAKRGPASPNWRGGNHSVGYRVVAALKIGRPLKKGEIVHHIDGDRANNAPENLDVLENQGDHMRRHAAER